MLINKRRVVVLISWLILIISFGLPVDAANYTSRAGVRFERKTVSITEGGKDILLPRTSGEKLSNWLPKTGEIIGKKLIILGVGLIMAGGILWYYVNRKGVEGG